MARECVFTGKKRTAGNYVTFSNKKIKRSFKPNLRRVKAVIDGKVQKVWVSTKALKSGLVERPNYSERPVADAE